MSDKIVITEGLLKKLGLCSCPDWAKHTYLSSFPFPTLVFDHGVKVKDDVEEFIKAVHKRFPDLASNMCCNPSLLPVVSLKEVFQAYLIVGLSKKFFSRLDEVIRQNPVALAFFTDPGLQPGDVVRGKLTGNYYLIRETAIDQLCRVLMWRIEDHTGKPKEDVELLHDQEENLTLVYRP